MLLSLSPHSPRCKQDEHPNKLRNMSFVLLCFTRERKGQRKELVTKGFILNLAQLQSVSEVISVVPLGGAI